MATRTAQFKVNIPSLTDVGERFPQYAGIVREDGRDLYELLTEPRNVVRALLKAQEGAAPVEGVARAAYEPASKLSSGNRLVGAIVCCIVEANGFEKTGKKRSIPVDGYSRGEVYTLNPKKAADWLT